MSFATYILGIVAALLTLIVVVEMLRRGRMRERHAIWWILAGTAALIVGIFPGIIDWVGPALGVAVSSNLVFFLSIAVLFLVCIQHSSELTTLESKTRTLAERSALEQLRIDELERTVARLVAERESES